MFHIDESTFLQYNWRNRPIIKIEEKFVNLKRLLGLNISTFSLRAPCLLSGTDMKVNVGIKLTKTLSFIECRTKTST